MDLQNELGLSYLFIAHDPAVVKRVSGVIAVMYLGKIVEIGACGRTICEPASLLHQGSDLGDSGPGPKCRQKADCHSRRRSLSDRSHLPVRLLVIGSMPRIIRLVWMLRLSSRSGGWPLGFGLSLLRKRTRALSGQKLAVWKKTCGTARLRLLSSLILPLTSINQKFDFMKLASLFCVAFLAVSFVSAQNPADMPLRQVISEARAMIGKGDFAGASPFSGRTGSSF